MGGKLAAHYLRHLEQRPLITLALTTSLRMGLGDCICQGIEISQDREKTYQMHRTTTFMKYGFLVNGPFLHVVYSRVYTIFPQSIFGTI